MKFAGYMASVKAVTLTKKFSTLPEISNFS